MSLRVKTTGIYFTCPNCGRKLKGSKNDLDKLVCTKKCGYEWVAVD